MAATTNGTGNLVDEFEESFLSVVQLLTREEENFSSLEKDNVDVDIEQCSVKFLDSARQLEGFFLQKRFLLSALKPELLIKEEIVELKNELARKDELIKRHYDKIEMWQNVLADVREKSPTRNDTNQGPNCQAPIVGSNIGTLQSDIANPIINVMPQQFSQQQAHQQMQHQQTQKQIQQQMPVGMGSLAGTSSGLSGVPIIAPQQAMFVQQQNIGQRMSPFPNTMQGGMIPGPLAFLEKTTSNIGMSEVRR